MTGNLLKRLPAIIAFSMGILVGTICYVNGLRSNDICIRIVIAFLLFYLVGILVRKTIGDIGVENVKDIVRKGEKGGNIDIIVGDGDEISGDEKQDEKVDEKHEIEMDNR